MSDTCYTCNLHKFAVSAEQQTHRRNSGKVSQRSSKNIRTRTRNWAELNDNHCLPEALFWLIWAGLQGFQTRTAENHGKNCAGTRYLIDLNCVSFVGTLRRSNLMQVRHPGCMVYQSSKRRWVANDRQCCLLLHPVVNSGSGDGMEYYSILLLWLMLYGPETNEAKNDKIQVMVLSLGLCPNIWFTDVIFICNLKPWYNQLQASLWKLRLGGHSGMGYRGCHSAPLSQLDIQIKISCNLGVFLGCIGLYWFS